MTDDFERLILCRHHDPHGVLGVHGTSHGAVFRCVRPDAMEVEVSSLNEKPQALRQIGTSGLWEGDLPGPSTGRALVVRARYKQGPDWVTVDP